MTAVYSDLIPGPAWQAKKQNEARHREDSVADALSPEEQRQYEILSYCAHLYDQGRKARQPYETFDMAWDLYMGNVWPNRWPSWRPKVTINKIRAFITFMQAVMTDVKPRFAVEALLPGSESAADLLRKLADRDWDENDLQRKISIFNLYGLIWGTGIMKVFYDPYADGGRGKHMAVPIVPYRFYTNRTASGIDDAEFAIHIDDKTMGWIRRNFPDRANAVYTLRGVTATDERDPLRRDYIREGDSQEVQRIVTAQNVDGNITGPMMMHPNPAYHDRDQEEVEIGEYYYRDETLESFKRPKWDGGKPVTEPMTGDDGMYVLQTKGYRTETSSIDGQPFIMPIKAPKQKPVMEEAWRFKYPNGRLTIIAGGRVLLRDIPTRFRSTASRLRRGKIMTLTRSGATAKRLRSKTVRSRSTKLRARSTTFSKRPATRRSKCRRALASTCRRSRTSPASSSRWTILKRWSRLRSRRCRASSWNSTTSCAVRWPKSPGLTTRQWARFQPTTRRLQRLIRCKRAALHRCA